MFSLQDRYDIVCEENRQLKERLAAFVDKSFDPLKEMDIQGSFTPQEKQLLCVLWKHKEQVVPFEAIMNAIYLFNDERPQNYDILKVYASRLRPRLSQYKIVSVFGVGYRLTGVFEKCAAPFPR